ncbi:Phosphotransferase enzyme [Cadophora gregata f. sp. sojae]|nr:Phosphotransferase enzyme [Cadophora gregata f. sp. sojae]
MPALIDAAVHAAGNGAKACVKLLKCTEGQYNKAFLMSMDNGVEVLAKVPNPNAGPAFYTTASEVATRQFLRTVLKLPVPRIHAFSSTPDNPVGAEYIIEEKAKGKPLGNLWRHWDTESQISLVTQLVNFETKLASVTFRRHGCIYYKKDLEMKGLPAYDLEAESLCTDDLTQLNLIPTKELAIGPLTEARLWEGERSTMQLDRGPWSTPLSYMASMGINEIKWATENAKPQINPYRSIETPESPNDYISLLKDYLQLAPYLSPGPFRTSISHPDLHLDNIFVDPDTKKITCIIDWQSASVSEPFFQDSIPRMLIPVDQCSPSDRLDPVSYSDVGDPNEIPSLLSHYRNMSRAKNDQHWAAMNLHNRSLLTEPTSLICGAWSRNDMFSLRHALIHVIARWKEIAPTTLPCPVTFAEHELELHNSELELHEGLGEVLHQLQNDNLIPLGGMVLREKYEQASLINQSIKKMFVEMAETKSQKALYSRIWPYQDQETKMSKP